MDLLGRLFILSPIKENKKFTNVFTRNIFEFSYVVTNFSNIAVDTSGLIHRCGYNIGQLETPLGFNRRRYHCVF